MVTCVPGWISLTASARTCAASWRRTSSPSGSFRVMMATSASASMTVARSRSSPSSRTATASRASPLPMDSASSRPFRGRSNRRTVPSGRVIFGMGGPRYLEAHVRGDEAGGSRALWNGRAGYRNEAGIATEPAGMGPAPGIRSGAQFLFSAPALPAWTGLSIPYRVRMIRGQAARAPLHRAADNESRQWRGEHRCRKT